MPCIHPAELAIRTLRDALLGGRPLTEAEEEQVRAALEGLRGPVPQTPGDARRPDADDYESEDIFCADPCGGLLYLARSAGSAWVAVCGSCGKTWPRQPWADPPATTTKEET
jgi:hypothetical protein